MLIFKICKKCQKEKDISNFCFGKNKGVVYFYKTCKTCDKERILKKTKRYKNKNRAKLAEKQKEYYSLHQKEYNTYNKNYYINNKQKIKENSKKYLYNKRKNDCLFRIKENIASRIGNLIHNLSTNNVNYNYKKILINKSLPFSYDDFQKHIELLFESWMNWNNYGKYEINSWDDNDPLTWTWNIDHIIPYSKLKYSSLEDDNFKNCWALKNLRPYSSKQNILDGNRR